MGVSKNAGLNRVNISYDAFNPTTYKKITNKDYCHEVRKGVVEAVDAGLNPVKLNMVILKDIKHGDIPYTIEFECSNEGVNDLIFKKYHYSLNKLEIGAGKKDPKYNTAKYTPQE